jgi:diamine N-acetyltransferase
MIQPLKQETNVGNWAGKPGPGEVQGDALSLPAHQPGKRFDMSGMLQGSMVRLRAIEPSDLELMYDWENDTEIWKVSGTVSPYSKYTLEEYIKTCEKDIYANRQLRFAIELLDHTRQTVGLIDLFEFDPQHRKAGVGILIGDRGQRRKHYAREALGLLVDYAFHHLNLHQLYCQVPESNQASLRLFASAGFREAGILKDWVFAKNTWEHVVWLQLINEEDQEE